MVSIDCSRSMTPNHDHRFDPASIDWNHFRRPCGTARFECSVYFSAFFARYDCTAILSARMATQRIATVRFSRPVFAAPGLNPVIRAVDPPNFSGIAYPIRAIRQGGGRSFRSPRSRYHAVGIWQFDRSTGKSNCRYNDHKAIPTRLKPKIHLPQKSKRYSRWMHGQSKPEWTLHTTASVAPGDLPKVFRL